MPCLPADHAALRRIREGRRTGELTLRELGALVDALRARGHSTRRIARATGVTCASLRGLRCRCRCR